MQEDKDQNNYQPVLLDYLDHLRERSLSDVTVDNYRRDLVAFFGFCEKRGCVDPADLLPEHIIAYLDHLRVAEERKPSTMGRHSSAIRGFCRFLQSEKIKADDISQNLLTPKNIRPLPDFLTEEQIDKLLSLPDTSTKFGIRDKAILEVMYGCGLRVSEVVGLRIHDIHPHMGLIQCFGKGGKERRIPIGGYALAAIADYLNRSRSLLLRDKKTDELFLNRFGNKLSRSGIWRIIEGYGKKILDPGSDYKIHPHALRHSAATHMLANGADLRTIQEFLGHENIETTEIYTEVNIKERAAVFERYHPRAKIHKE